MSHTFFNKQWQEAQQQISDLMVEECPEEPVKPETDKTVLFQTVATLYVKYIQIFRRLEQCYDQVVHPQKRILLRKLLDGVIGRVLELKHELVGLDCHYVHYLDDILQDMKLTPADLEMPIPKYYRVERAKILKEREKMLSSILARIGAGDTKEADDFKMSISDAIQLVQVHERARQGRLRAKFMREIRQQEEKENEAAARGVPTLDPEVAAIRIQKVWKGFAARKRVRKEREEEMMFIHMMPPPMPPYKSTPQYQATKNEDKRRVTQETNEQEYRNAEISVKQKIREVEGPDMKETLQESIREWFIETRDATGKFPEFPEEDEGGSTLIFKEKDPAELAKELEEEAEGGDKKKGKKGKKSGKKDKKDKKGKKGGKKGKKGKGDDDDDDGLKMAESKFVPKVKDATNEYDTKWKTRDESLNFSQKHDIELIKEEKRKEVEEEIRIQVDELMRQELKNLKMAVDKDKGKKGGKKKSGKKKGKKGKKGKKSGKKKGKKEKDLTPDRSIESLYEELVEQGVLARTPKVHMTDFLGEFNYLGTVLRQRNLEPQVSLHDVRRVVTEYCILPMGSQEVHELGGKDRHIKSVLLAGPEGVGKKHLINAVCTETGANLFDLSADTIAGKYPGKSGLTMLIHMVMKVGKALQPSVIFIGDAEKTFLKKVPKTDTSDPKRLKKDLPKILKAWNPGERLLLIGTTSKPLDCDIKSFTKLYQQIVLIPRPEYATRQVVLRYLIMKHGGTITQALDISSLAKVTDGFTVGQIDAVIKAVLTDRRLSQMAKKAITASEFLGPLSSRDPVYKQDEDNFAEFFKKTPLGKKRAEAMKGDGDDDGGKGGKGKKGAKSGKKGKKGKKK